MAGVGILKHVHGLHFSRILAKSALRCLPQRVMTKSIFLHASEKQRVFNAGDLKTGK
jgi:hypothetical protein